MTVSVVFPWRSGCKHREHAFDYVRDLYTLAHPDWEQIVGVSPDGPFNRSAAILNGARKASGSSVVVADADVWCDPVDAIAYADSFGWARPHNMIHRLSEESTHRVYAGENWRSLPLSDDNHQDQRPYRGNDTGTLVVVRRDVLFDVPPDVRFVGWGREDNAWGRALSRLVGPVWCGNRALVHLWHPPQPRPTRAKGCPASENLWGRYRKAGTVDAMRHLIEEAKHEWTSLVS